MLGVANTLVRAIQRTVKPQLPVGGSKTGGGGMAADDDDPNGACDLMHLSLGR